jgi:4-hydroxybenzoyl-CoA reductase subunit beta
MPVMPDFELLHPDSVEAAVALHASRPASRYLAGGTDLLPNLRRGLADTATVIDLTGIAELAGIRIDADVLHIGAGTTLATLTAHPEIGARLPALAQAALAVAGPTHRESATLGGNLCLDTRCRYYNQSAPWREANHFCMKLEGDVCRVAPKSKRCYAAFSGDVAPALLALDAEVDIVGTNGRRTLALAEFYRDDGMRWLALDRGELLASVRVPLAPGWSSGYEKLRIRGAIDFPLSGVAVALARDGERLVGLRIACTGVSSRPERIEGLDALVGQPLDDAAFTRIERSVLRGIQSMETTTANVQYRRRATPILARRLVDRLWAQSA